MRGFRKALALLRGTLGRLSTGGLALLTCAWLAGGEFTGEVDWEPTIAFLVALLAWLISSIPEEELTEHTQAPVVSEDDRALFRSFVSKFSAQERDFIKNHDFGAAFEWRSFSGLDRIADTWNGPEYEFQHDQARLEMKELLERMRAFRSLLAQKTFAQGTSGFSRMFWNEDYSQESEDRSRRTQKMLNEAADELVEAAESFIRRYQPIFGLGK